MKVKATAFAMIVFKDVSKLEHDAQAQYKFNRFWAILWFCSLVGIPFVPSLYAHTISALIIQEISLWANFATHFGAMSSALAADKTKAIVDDMSDDIDDIGKDTDVLRTAVGVEPVQG